MPGELFQKRTSRKNRVLISWKTVKNNCLTIKQLESFEGGVVVEFVNEDFFEPENQLFPVFVDLQRRIGSDEKVSSIITIRSESGSSSSQVQRDNFFKLIRNTNVIYDGALITINEKNYRDFSIERHSSGGSGNETWSGFLFVSIRGGQQDTIQTHEGRELLLFNPACEYASSEVCTDIDLTMAYYALISIGDPRKRNSKYFSVLENVKKALSESFYNNSAYKGNLLSYCNNHPSVKMIDGQLTDPIQVERIEITDFSVDNKEDSRNIDFTHDEAVNKGIFYWDTEKETILSPARPTNIFWSKHLSNMMQQNYSLSEYFDHEKEISKRRAELMNK